MIISEDQANQIARCIVFDIQDFIKEHQAEYKEFLEKLKFEDTGTRKKEKIKNEDKNLF